jgi:glycosyltransferase involved in cell wall biosynthesis
VKILFHCWEYPPRGSGIGKYIGEISAGLRNAGHETIIVTSAGDGLPDEEQLNRGRVYRLYDCNEIGDPALAERVLAIANKHDVDLIESVDHLGEAAELLKLRPRPPILINCRYNDVVRRARYAQAWYKWQKRIIDLACLRDWRRLGREKFCIENADLLAAPSAWMLDALRAQGIKLSSHTAVLPKPLSPMPEWKNNESRQPTLLLVGRIDVGKGIPYLGDVLANVAGRFPDVCLEIAGDDSYARFLGSMRSWTERHLGGQSSRVRFLGQLGPKELDDAYRRAWVVIVPSRWDTSPTALLEAMVRGKAVVASPFGGMPEYLSGTDCVIANPETSSFPEAVTMFLADERKRRDAGRSALLRAESEYSPAACVLRYLEFVGGFKGVSK